jgi:large exoprotein involved in heme utilization and adhesion
MGSEADLVVLSGSSAITSDAREFSGDGGRISITATSLDLDEASSIRSSTSAIGSDLDGDGVLDITGRGGDIVVAVQRLSVLGGGSITSRTDGSNDGAAAGGTVTVQGLEGSGSRASSVVLSGLNTGIVSDSALGLPGDITVNAGTLTITNGAVIAAGTIFSTGPAGNVTVTADSVVLSSSGQILSQSFAQDAGDVTISANRLALDSGSIVTSTFSGIFGRGGDVVLNGGAVSLTNGASVNSQSETFSNGRAGDITMNVDSLTLDNHAEITSSSKGIAADAGDAGNITIHSRSTVLLNNSAITTEASEASGGRITVNAPEMIRLTNSQISTSVAGSEVDTSGGDINIDPIFAILQNSQILAQAFAGTGGNINLVSNVFLSDPNSLVDASSQLGVSGTVNIQAPVQNVSGELVVLSQDFSSAAALLAQQCAARVADGKFSTFVVAAREGLPVEPGGFLASPSFLTELGGSAFSKPLPSIPRSAGQGLLPEYDTRPLRLAELGNACRR